MANSQTNKGQRPSGAGKRNQGEGDQASARRFNEAQQSFVKSRRGEQAVAQAGDAEPDEAQELKQAGRARARGEDPAVTRIVNRDDEESRSHDE